MTKKPVVFQVLDWREYNEDIDVPSDYHNYSEETQVLKNKYFFRVFGRTPSGKSVHIKCVNFIPHFYVKIPDFWLNPPPNRSGMNNKEWLSFCCERFITELKKRNSYLQNHLINYDILKKHDFRTFTAGKMFNFIRLIFDNSKAMKSFSYTLDSKISIMGVHNYLVKYDLYENNIDPFLRAAHIQDLKFAGFIKVFKYADNSEVEETTCDINLFCDWTDIKPLNETELTRVKSAPFRILSYDIECDSSDGNFPRPTPTTHDQNGNPLDKIRPADKIIQIGSVFSKYGTGIYKKHIITLNSCTEIEGAEVVCVESERDLLTEWANLVQKEDPDIIVGYNIFGFDDEFMHLRSQQPDVDCEDIFNKLGKLINIPCKYETKSRTSAGLGDNFLKYIDCPGRVKIDLMKVIQEGYKLTSYGLDPVSENFIQDEIISYDILDNHHMKIKSKGLHFIKVGNYVKLIDNAAAKYGLIDEKYDDHSDNEEDDDIENNYDDNDPAEKNEFVKYKVTEITDEYMIITHGKQVFSKEMMDELGQGTKWGLAKDDLKAKKMFELQKGSADDRAVIAKYCIQDCVLVSKLLDKLEIVTNYIGMANVSNVPFYYLLTRGQGIKGLSLVSKECRKIDYLLPYLRVKSDDADDVGYEGAIVFEPKLGFYQSPIFVLDFNSLYPSSIISYNVSHETLVVNPEYDNLPDYDYKDITYRNNDGTTTTCRYARNKDGTFGILPTILQKLLSERKATKKEMKNEKDAFKKSILDGHQLALKQTANSAYGLLGTKKSPIGFVELAASTTAIGRLMLSTARDFAENELLPIIKLYYEAIKARDTNLIDELNEQYLADKSDDTVKFICQAIPTLVENYGMGVHVMYGDSCTGDTPLLIFDKGYYVHITVEELCKRYDNWKLYSGFKPNDTQLKNKLYCDISDEYIFINTHLGLKRIKKLVKHLTYKKIYRIVTKKGCVDVTEDHSLLTPDVKEIKPIDCTIGQKLLHRYPKSAQTTNDTTDTKILGMTASKLVAQELYMEYKIDYKNVYIQHIDTSSSTNKCSDNYIIYASPYNDDEDVIQNIILLHEKYDDYVYDIETEAGTFHAGIGEMIIKNTDSIFCNPNLSDPKTGELVKEKRAVSAAIQLGQLASFFIKKKLLYPHNLEYEKTFYPFCIMAKKKYVGQKFEDDDTKSKLSYMGIVLKRRDNANIVKKVLGGLVNIMMYENDIEKAKKYLYNMCKNLLAGKYPISDFVTTKALRSTYAGTKLTTDDKGNEGDKAKWYWDDVKCGQAHVRLCQRMKERDPGTAPNVNDRISMVTIYKPKKKGIKYLQGDLVETPEYIKDNPNIQIDYLFYLTNQIMNPVMQFAEHIVGGKEQAKALFEDHILDEEKKRKGIKKIGIQVSDYEPQTFTTSMMSAYDDDEPKCENVREINTVKPIDMKEAMLMPLPKKPRKKRAPTKQTKMKLSLYMEPDSDIETN